jgi:hypothetical protein
MTDLPPGQPNVVVRDLPEQKAARTAEPAITQTTIIKPNRPTPLMSCSDLTVDQRRRYANSEYDVAGTWASIACSSAMIFGLRSQT